MEEPRSFNDWEQWRAAHLDWFQRAGISDTIDYYHYFDQGYDTREEVIDDAKNNHNFESLSKMGVHGFERPAVAYEQNIAIVSINPKLGLSPDSGGIPTDPDSVSDIDRYDMNYRLGVKDTTKFNSDVVEAAGAGLNWLLNKCVTNYSHSVFRALINTVLSEQDIDALLKQDPRQTLDLHQNIYYTNWFKYATYSSDEMDDGLDSIGSAGQKMDLDEYFNDSDYIDHNSDPEYRIPNTVLAAELRRLKPDIILAFGRPVWDRFFKRKDGSIEPADEYLTGELASKGWDSNDTHSTLHSLPFWYQGSEKSGTRYLVIPLIFPQGQPWHPCKAHIRGVEQDGSPEKITEDRITKVLDNFY